MAKLDKGGVRAQRARKPTGSGNFGKHIWVGKKPPTKELAWWYLSRAAKDLLEQKRRQGFFGGVPGAAPYWFAQERGEVSANIEPLFYINTALTQWEARAKVKVDRFFTRR